MKRVILRSLILTLSIVLVISIAKAAPGFINKLTASNDGILQFLLVIGVLVVIILIVIFSNWMSQKIKVLRRKRKSKG